MPTNKTDRWLQGYACAVATLQRLDGSSARFLTTDVKELMSAGGMTLASCRAAQVDQYDMDALFFDDKPRLDFKCSKCGWESDPGVHGAVDRCGYCGCFEYERYEATK